MTEEEIQQSVVEIMRLRLFGHGARAPEQVKEVLLRVVRTTYREAIEEAAKRSYETVMEVDSPRYRMSQKATMVAAAVRRLTEEEEMKPKTGRR